MEVVQEQLVTMEHNNSVILEPICRLNFVCQLKDNSMNLDRNTRLMMAGQGVLELSTLGRPMQLGMLYDCRRDALIPGLTLWDPETLRTDRDVKPQPGTQFDIISSDGVDDKTSALNIDASLKASFLGGLVKVQGSAKYLHDTKSSQQQSRLTLHYKTTTMFEQLTMKQLGRHNVQYPDVFEQGTATHVVTGILYGAQAFFVFDRECKSEENNQDVQGHLHGMVKRIVSLEMDGKGSFKSGESESVDGVRCKFHGDFALELNPSTYEEAIDIYKKLPTMLGSNGENAVPMRVWLYPLDKLDHKAAKLVRQISVNLIGQSQVIIEGLEQLQLKCNDAIKQDTCKDFPQFPDKLNKFKKMLLDYKLSFQQKLAQVLPAIRGGGAEEQVLADTLQNSVESPFCLQSLGDWVASKLREINVVKAYMKLFAGIQVISSRADLTDLVLNPLRENVLCFSVPLDGPEEYLEILSKHLKSPDEKSQTLSCAWFDDASKSKQIRLRARAFVDFYHANKNTDSTAFAVTGFKDDESQRVEGGPIYLYEEGVLVTKDFQPPSNPGKPSVTRKSHHDASLEWPPPKLGLSEVKAYQVKYRQPNAQADWTTVSTDCDEENLTIEGLKPFTSYEFQVAAVCKAGISQVSASSDVCSTLPTSPPTQVRKHGTSESSMTVVWDPPALVGEGVVIERYLVRYKQVEHAATASPNQDGTKATSDQSCMLTIDDLQVGTCYKIWVSALCGKAGTSAESNPREIATDPINKPAKYAMTITQEADVLSEGCASTGEPKIFKIPLVPDPQVSEKYRSYSYGNKPNIDQHHKVIMVVGATGAGKSTLINGMINYILQVDWKDGFRFKIVDAEGEGDHSQAYSQTQIITSYTIYKNKHYSIPYTITIIDTPGFGDTRGIDRDRVITDQIRHFFNHSEAHRIDHIDAIGFVAQSSLARLTHTQRYVFDSILSVFGKDISSNILLLVTFADGQKPPVVQAVKEAEIPCSNSVFKFNNSALFASNKAVSAESTEMGSLDEADLVDNFDQMFWRMGVQSMSSFFKALDNLESRSLSLTKQVLDERKRLEIALEGLQPQIEMGVCKLEELRNEQQILEQHEAEIQANKSFEYEVDVPKSRMINVTDYITNCSKCHFTCHYPCAIANDADKSNCGAMSNGYCFICPGKCIWDVHFNQKYKFEYYTEKEHRTYAELEERYKDATGKKLTVEQVIQKHADEFLSVQKCVFVLITNSHTSLKRLEEIALKPNPLSTVEYVDLLIQSEKSEGKLGWMARVRALNDIRRQADIMGKVKQANYDPFENYREEFLGKKKANKSWIQTFTFWK